MHIELYKLSYENYQFMVELDTGAEVGEHQVTVWFREQGDAGEPRFLRAFYFEEANDDNICTFCREFALYPDYRAEILSGQRHWVRRNTLFVRNLYSVLGEGALLASARDFEGRAREFFRWLDLHAERILALPMYQQLQRMDSAFQPDAKILDPLIEPVVTLLNQIPGVITRFSCQGVSGKVRFGAYELLAISPHEEYAYVSFELLGYFAHDAILAHLAEFLHITTARIPWNSSSEFLLRSTGDNARFRSELMALARCILAAVQGAQRDEKEGMTIGIPDAVRLTHWEVACYPERRPRIATPGGIVPSRLQWLCQPEQIERTLHLLFHLNHWAKASQILFYADRQGLYTIKAALIEQAYAAHLLEPMTYVEGTSTFAQEFSIEMAAAIAAEFLLERLALIFERRKQADEEAEEAMREDDYDRAALQLFQDISGRAATAVQDIQTITLAQAAKHIRASLYSLIEQARLTRQPIAHSALSALLVGPTDLLDLPYNRERLLEYWHELDETNARKLDPEGCSLIAFQYTGATASYTFHLPFRITERFLPSELLQELRQYAGYSREHGVYYGRALDETESEAYPLAEILYELAVNIEAICPRKLARKADVYTPISRVPWEEDEEDEDCWYVTEKAEKRRGRSKRAKNERRNAYRARRHRQATCPLCKNLVIGGSAARIAHWSATHPEQDLTVGQATWVLCQSEWSLKSAELKPDYHDPDAQPGQNGTRYWKLTSLATHTTDTVMCS